MLAVVFYHFSVPGFPGGFVGVDIFFVISGFLMTAIIVSGLESGHFSVLTFYLARAKRIIPALIVLCAVLLILGWFWLPTPDYRTLGAHVAVAVAFVSNIEFWREAGYFDAASHEKWLLHTWSLSVEWQFYLLLPFMLIIVWRIWAKAGVRWALLMVSIGSFAWSVYATHYWPSAAFYLLPTRAWEMLVGGLVWTFTERRRQPLPHARTMEAIGLTLIVISIACFGSDTPWPGAYAALPVVGTLLVLLSARQDSVLTANPITRWLGLRSYSIYLWHWPIVVLPAYTGMNRDPAWLAAGMIATLALGAASYRLVELPARKGFAQLRPKDALMRLIAALSILVMMVIGVRIQNFSGRMPPAVDLMTNEAKNKNPRQDECLSTSGVASKSCIYGGKKLRAIVIGDSHADTIMTAVQGALPSADDGVLNWTYLSCPTIAGARIMPGRVPAEQRCFDFNNWALKKLPEFPKEVPVVMVTRTSVYAFGHNELWENDSNKPLVYLSKQYVSPEPEFLNEFRQSLVDTACAIAKQRPVFLMRPIPEMGVDVPKVMGRRLVFGGDAKKVSISLTEYHERQAFVWAAQDEAAERCGVKILDPLPYLCSDGRCWGIRDGRSIYYDDDHLSEYGNKALIPMFRRVFQ